MRIAVKWVFQQVKGPKGVLLEAGQKPALCFRGRTHMLAVAAAHPVRVLKRPVADFDRYRDVTVDGGSPYPVEDAVKRLKEIVSRNGATAAARTLLERAANPREGDIDESVYEDEEEITMTKDERPTDEAVGDKGEDTNTTEAEMTTANTETTKTKKAKAPPKAGKKVKAAKPKAEKKVKAAKPKAEKKAKVEKKGDGLGREGSIARFFNEGIIAGKENEELTKAARKRFPDNVIRDNYVAYCRQELEKKGLYKRVH